MVRSPSSCGSVETDRSANRLMIRGESSSRSSEPRHPPEQREPLLQVDADAAEQHLGLADVPLVGQRRRVERQQRHVVAAREQLDGQRVVAQAAAAIHPGGAGGDGQNLHRRSQGSGWRTQARKQLPDTGLDAGAQTGAD